MTIPARPTGVAGQRWTSRAGQLGWYGIVIGGTAVLLGIGWVMADRMFFGYALVGFVMTALAWLWKPRVGLYLTLFFGCTADNVTVAWFPMFKNLSSRESIMYVADSFTVSPLELLMAWGLTVTIIRNLASTKRLVPRRNLTLSVLVVVPFVLWGLVYGVGTGGNPTIALWESRSLFCIAAFYVLGISVLETRRHMAAAMWAILAGVVVQSLLSIQYYTTLSALERADVEALNEHGSSVGMALFLVVVITMIVLRAGPLAGRAAVALGAIPVALVFVVGQRRAGFVAFAGGLLLFTCVLFVRRRRTFYRIVPPAALCTVAFIGATWNASGLAGFAAQSVKSVVAPDQLSAEDQSSDLYRVIENVDLMATIHAKPVTGIGFGQKFYRPIALPDISTFPFFEYMPHNSVLWLWMKLGFFGFAAMVVLFSRSLGAGARRVREASDPLDATVKFGFTAFIFMFALFAYVDIAFFSRNLMLLGVAIACCASPIESRRVAVEDRLLHAPRPASLTSASPDSRPQLVR